MAKLALLAAAGLAGLLGLTAVATLVLTAWIEARYPPNGRFVAIGGGRLHYLESGPAESAFAIVLLHGASGTSADPMLALGNGLAARHRVVAFDRPGHGWSDRILGADAHSPAVQARLLREGLTKLGVRRALIVGHSWSGALATNLALDHADLVAGLVLLSPVSHPWPGGAVSWYYFPSALRGLGWVFTRTVAAPLGFLFVRPAVRSVFAPQPPFPDYAERVRLPLLFRPRVFQANAEDVAGLHAFVTQQSRRYGAIKAPTVVIAGAADRIVWTDLHARSLEREVPGARLIVLPGVGHMPHFAAPDLVRAEIEALAGQVGADP